MSSHSKAVVKTPASPVPASKGRAPLEPFGVLRTEIDKLFDDFMSPSSVFIQPRGTASISPAMEFVDTGAAYQLTAELPGLKGDDIDVSVADGVLTLSGEKREESERESNGILLSERRYGAFRRQIPLPSDVDSDAVDAHYKHGVLRVEIAKDKTAAGRSRRIAVKS